jgi:hypothetical protein
MRDYERLLTTQEAMTVIAMTMLMSRRLACQTPTCTEGRDGQFACIRR